MAQAKKVGIVKSAPADLAVMEDWEKDLVNKAKDAKAAEVTGIPQIKHRGGFLKIDDKKVEGNKLQCAVVCYGLTKKFYAEAFDPDAAEGQTPVCYAFGLPTPGAEGEMVPHPAAPEKQAERCTGCPHNKFGTAEKGRGKRCNDVRKLIVILENKDPDSVAKAQVRQIEVPKGSLRNWGNYLKSLDDVSPYGVQGVLTQIGTEPQENGGYTLTFSAVDKLAKDFVRAIYARASQLTPELSTPFPVLEAGEKPAKKPAKKIKGQE